MGNSLTDSAPIDRVATCSRYAVWILTEIFCLIHCTVNAGCLYGAYILSTEPAALRKLFFI